MSEISKILDIFTVSAPHVLSHQGYVLKIEYTRSQERLEAILRPARDGIRFLILNAYFIGPKNTAGINS